MIYKLTFIFIRAGTHKKTDAEASAFSSSRNVLPELLAVDIQHLLGQANFHTGLWLGR